MSAEVDQVSTNVVLIRLNAGLPRLSAARTMTRLSGVPRQCLPRIDCCQVSVVQAVTNLRRSLSMPIGSAQFSEILAACPE